MEGSLHYTVYIIFMALGALTFFAWSRDPKGVHQTEYTVAILIPVWSGLVYLAMSFGLGQTEVAGQTTYWGRYVDWIITTPLLITALALTGMHRLKQRDSALLLALIGTDVVMIACGLVADLSTGPARTVFFLCGVVALLVLLWLTWGPLRRLAFRQGDDLGGAYTTAAAVLSALWFAYPIIWWLGPSGTGAIGQTLESWLYVIVPIVSKVGFSALDLYLLRKLSPTAASNPAFDDHEPRVATR